VSNKFWNLYCQNSVTRQLSTWLHLMVVPHYGVMHDNIYCNFDIIGNLLISDTHSHVFQLYVAMKKLGQFRKGAWRGISFTGWGIRLSINFYASAKARLTGGDIIFSTCPFVHPLPNSWTRCFDNDVLCMQYFNIFNRFWTVDANWHKWCTGQGHEMINFGGRRSKINITSRR